MKKNQLNRVNVYRYFNGEYSIKFPDFLIPVSTIVDKIYDKISIALKNIAEIEELKSELLTKEKILEGIRIEIKNLDDARLEIEKQEVQNKQVPTNIVGLHERLSQLVPESPAQTSQIIPRLRQLLEYVELEEKRLKAEDPSLLQGVLETVLDQLPKFVYYSSYGNLDSDIYLPHVVENLERTDLSGREVTLARTLRVLFNYVGLQPRDILELGKEANPKATPEEIESVSKQKEERSLLLQSAGTNLTKEFKNWWKQGDYRFRFQADGNFFKIWVSDDKRPEEVKLESRSTGLQWFLSFFLVFLVESKGENKNAILLLDEPGHSLHPLAQRDLSEFFANLSRTNQLMYTTHSPFLIDADRLERARKVYVGDDGTTKATSDLRYGNDNQHTGAAYAVHSALNLSIAESLLIGCEPVIVEGASDQIYMTTIKSLLIGAGDIAPKKELVFPPGGGTKTSRSVASILTGRDEKLPLILLDGDQHGLSMIEQLKSSMYQGNTKFVLCTDDFTGIKKSEIEDLFPPALIAEILDRWFRAEKTFVPDTDCDKPIVSQIERWAERTSVTLDKKHWKVELAKRVKKKALQDGMEKIPDEYRERWTKLFEKFMR